MFDDDDFESQLRHITILLQKNEMIQMQYYAHTCAHV